MQALELGPGEIQVWICSTEQLRAERAVEPFELSESERRRARRYRFAKHREAFELRRGFAHRLLLGYCGPAHTSLELDERCVYCGAAHGKPRLPAGAADWLRFSWSHSDDRVIYAFANGTDIGVDIERIDPLGDWHGAARQALAPEELQRVEATGATRRAAAFYALWTQKEALAKALALGLVLPLREIELSADHDGAPRLIKTPLGVGSPTDWTLHDLDVAAGFAAAVAVRGPIENLHIATESPAAPVMRRYPPRVC